MRLTLLKSFFLTLIIATAFTYVCVVISEFMFTMYYHQQWGTSAQIMHSPPFGVNFVNKLALVKFCAISTGVLTSIPLSFILSRRLFFKQKNLPNSVSAKESKN